MKLSNLQKEALKNLCVHKVFYINNVQNQPNIGSKWMDKTMSVCVSDSTMRRLKNFGLVQFGKTKKNYMAVMTELGEKVAKEI